MSESESQNAWLILKKCHAVPISGLSPEEIKASRKGAIEADEEKLKTTSYYNAVVNCLGFPGGFGTYKPEGWPRVQRIMQEHGLQVRRDLVNALPGGLLMHGWIGHRQLADRIFLSNRPVPSRVFTGYGLESTKLDQYFGPTVALGTDEGEYTPTDIEDALRWLYQQRLHLPPLWNFLGDQLLQTENPGDFVWRMYYSNDQDPSIRARERKRAANILKVFGWIFDRSNIGWLEIVPVTDRLVFLKGPNGYYDIVWKGMRTQPPPKHDVAGYFGVHLSFLDWYYFQPDRWEERDRHEAESHFYEHGGSAFSFKNEDVILEQYLRFTSEYNGPADHEEFERACERAVICAMTDYVKNNRKFSHSRPAILRLYTDAGLKVSYGSADEHPVSVFIELDINEAPFGSDTPSTLDQIPKCAHNYIGVFFEEVEFERWDDED